VCFDKSDAAWLRLAIEKRTREALKVPGRTEGVRKIAARFGVNASTVQRINADPFVAEAA
jgi:hypothetical protein